MLDSIIHSRLSFFDTTPIGRILSRFSSDMSITDATIPDQVASFFYFGFQVIFIAIKLSLRFCVLTCFSENLPFSPSLQLGCVLEKVNRFMNKVEAFSVFCF